MRTGLAPVLLAAVLLVAAAPASADTTWVNIPGTAGTWARAIEADTPPATVYYATEGSGVFKSTNGGLSFDPFSGGLSGGALTVRAIVPGSTTYAGTQDGLFSSSGGSWTPVGQGDQTNPPTKLKASVQAFLTNPTTPGQMLAGTFASGVWSSSDGGGTWTPPAPGNGMPSGETVWGLTAHPFTAGLVFAATSSGVYRSTDFGSTWTLASDGIPFTTTLRVWVDFKNPNIYYVGTNSGVYRSINAGITWSAINSGLGNSTVRGLQAFEGDTMTNLYAATGDGAYHARTPNGPTAGPVKWRAVTKSGLGSATIFWAIENFFPNPLIYAGTQNEGVFGMTMTPPSNDVAPSINDTTPVVGQTLTANKGTWSGTETIDYAYQWQRCSTSAASSCTTDIPGAEGTQYVVTSADQTKYLRVVVTAENPFPTFVGVKKESAVSGIVAANPGTLPGATQNPAPSIEIVDPGDDNGQADVGDTLRVKDGPFAGGTKWQNPNETSASFQWYRCDNAGNNCFPISGATARNYQLVNEDAGLRLRVTVTGTNAAGSNTTPQSGPTNPVIAEPATSIPPGPQLAGNAFVGQTLVGNVGEWKAPDTFFERRWEQCSADGSGCVQINKVASVEPETGPGYVVRAEDLGKTIKMKVKADVGNDPNHTLLPAAVEVYTPLSAVVTEPPPDPNLPGNGPGDPNGGPNGSDTVAPVISSLSLKNKKFRVGKKATAISAASPVGTVFRLTLSELSTLKIAIQRKQPGRKVKGKCVKPRRANRKRPKCTRFVPKGTLTRKGRNGKITVPFSGRVGKTALRPGAYRALLTATDAAGNRSKVATVAFKIVRR